MTGKKLDPRPAPRFLASFMLRRASLVITLAAWLLATGSQWDLVQTYGWGRMIVAYSRVMPLRMAVAKTFAGEELCGVCVAVQNGRRQQDESGAKAPGPKAPEKIFVTSSARVYVFAASALTCTGFLPEVASGQSAELSAPPGPPPRLAA